jgi:hypothetical protein
VATDKRVELTDPYGQKFRASTPAEVSNLVYGAGYKVPKGMTVDEAIAQLAEEGPVAEQLAASQGPPVPAVDAGGAKGSSAK